MNYERSQTRGGQKRQVHAEPRRRGEKRGGHESWFICNSFEKWGGHNPVGVDGLAGESTQGSLARSATLGWRAQSLWDWVNKAVREEHSIRFMGGEQVRREHGTPHEPRKNGCTLALTCILSPRRGASGQINLLAKGLRAGIYPVRFRLKAVNFNQK